MTTMSASQPDLRAVKQRQQAAWSSGDYSVIGTTLSLVGETLCEAADLRAGQRVIDVAAGNGNASLAAARRGCEVTSTDYVPALLAHGRERAAAERLPIEFQHGDAEDLPFADGGFDAALSIFGVMFTPDHEQAAREMARVCRPGGTIALACWTPEGFVGQMFRIIGKYVPPAPGVRSPALWGTEQHLSTIFGDTIASMQATPRDFVFRYRSAEHWLEVFRTYYGPMLKAFAALDEAGQAGLATDLLDLARRFHQGGPGLAARSQYLEIVMVRRA
jgi:ubiquinone/menaquinone biosynthesis C-methylase UbiE